jgi:hypothetical protein
MVHGPPVVRHATQLVLPHEVWMDIPTLGSTPNPIASWEPEQQSDAAWHLSAGVD